MDGITDSINGHELEQTPGDNEGQECLEYCCPWGLKESDTTEQLKNSNNKVDLALQCVAGSVLSTTQGVVTTRPEPPCACWGRQSAAGSWVRWAVASAR